MPRIAPRSVGKQHIVSAAPNLATSRAPLPCPKNGRPCVLRGEPHLPIRVPAKARPRASYEGAPSPLVCKIEQDVGMARLVEATEAHQVPAAQRRKVLLQ